MPGKSAILVREIENPDLVTTLKVVQNGVGSFGARFELLKTFQDS